MSEHAVMPLSDYIAACDSIREKTGDTVGIKSGELTEQIGKVYKSGQLSVLKSSEYLQGGESGTAIAVNDVSSIEHELGVKVSSKNLIPYPYSETTQTIDGITFTDNGDGTITANGTATADAILQLYDVALKKGVTYTLSGCPSGGAQYATYWIGLSSYQVDDGNGNTFTCEFDIPSIQLFIGISPGVTCDNLVFKPQLEVGSTATEYTPYINDFSGVSVSRYGKNLFTTKGRTVRYFGGYANTNQRTMVENSVYVGYARNNYYTTANVNSYDISNPEAVMINSKSPGYGLGFNFKVKPNETYTVTYSNYDSTVNSAGVGFYTEDGVFVSHTNIEDVGYPLTFTVPSNCYWMILCFTVNSAYLSTEVYFNEIMLQLKTTSTEYEPYAEPQTVTADTDGTVTGITSLSPNMTLLTDSNNVTINLEYYKDVDLTIENLTEAIALSGGE